MLSKKINITIKSNEISRVSTTIYRRYISRSNDALKKTSIIDSTRINITLLNNQTNTSNNVAKLNSHILGSFLFICFFDV